MQTISRRGIRLIVLGKPQAAIRVRFNMMGSLFSSIFVGTAMPVHLTWPDLLLGWLATAVGAIVLWGLRWIENIMSVEQHASLAITLDQSGPKEDEIRGPTRSCRHSVRKISVRCGSGVRTLTLNVSQSRRRSEPAAPAIIEELTRRGGVVALEWRCLD